MKVSFSGVFWGLICIGIGFFFLYGSWGGYAEYKRVKDYTGHAVGHVTNKHFKLGADGGGNYYMDYWFMPSAGSKIIARSIVAKQQWDVLKVDDTMEIRFDKSNPNRSIPMYGGSPSLAYSFFMLVLGAVFMLFGLLRLINSFRKTSIEKSPQRAAKKK